MGATQHKEIRNSWGKHDNSFWKDISQLLEKNRDGTRTAYLKTWFLDHQHHLGACLKCKFLGLTCPTELGILGLGPGNLFWQPSPCPSDSDTQEGVKHEIKPTGKSSKRGNPERPEAREEWFKESVNDQKWPQKVLIRCLTPILQHASVSKSEIKEQTIKSF